MVYNPDAHHRRSIRLAEYDYAGTGAHFVTLCARERACLFGDVVAGEIRLSPVGRVVEEEWWRTGVVRPAVTMDVFVVMPNHLHGIIVIDDKRVGNAGAGDCDTVSRTRATHRVAPTTGPVGPARGSVGAIIAQFKAVTTKRVNARDGEFVGPLWQRNYYERVIRNDEELERIRWYICENSANWERDSEHPSRLEGGGRPSTAKDLNNATAD
jgi:REP element-mobilizing transposase RayT